MMIVLMAIFGLSLSCKVSEKVAVVDSLNTDLTNDYYVSNRPLLQQNPLIKLPVGSIKPQGWLRRQLELQADGFHGHLLDISNFLNKEDNAWLSSDGRVRFIKSQKRGNTWRQQSETG